MNKTTNDSKKLLALNKPKGYVVTRSDELGRKTVYDLLPDWVFHDGWMPVGRLDLESKGLLLFTTNGKIGDALTKPGNCIKVYEIWGQRPRNRRTYYRGYERSGKPARSIESSCSRKDKHWWRENKTQGRN